MKERYQTALPRTLALLLTACMGEPGSLGGDLGAAGTEGTSTTSSGDTATGAETSGSDDDSGGIKLDVGGGTGDEPPVDECKVTDDGNAPQCDEVAPPDSFAPAVQWEFTPDDENTHALVIPLVANLTDDDDNDVIDMCDVPDVVLLASHWTGVGVESEGRIYVLDGATGELHYSIPDVLVGSTTPALGDIDGDGIPEILATNTDHRMVAFEHDGIQKWVATEQAGFGAIALADLDNDGDTEIIQDHAVLDHEGALVTKTPGSSNNNFAVVVADLDGDDDGEIIHTFEAYHHDGTLYYHVPELVEGHNGIPNSGYPQVANLDADPEPEVLITSKDGFSVLEHDGTVKYNGVTPLGGTPWWYARPAAVHDFDGNGVAEFASATDEQYGVYSLDANLVWAATIKDGSGAAAGTAFDFLGDATAEAIYMDEEYMFVYDTDGSVIFQEPRSSATLIEYPIVADVDDDGSAEALIVSSAYLFAGGEPNPNPTLKVIRDAEDRWVPARRIWNQHTYHVTNVREDGTIPQVEPRSWALLNTYRTQAQIGSDGGICEPDPEG